MVRDPVGMRTMGYVPKCIRPLHIKVYSCSCSSSPCTKRSDQHGRERTLLLGRLPIMHERLFSPALQGKAGRPGLEESKEQVGTVTRRAWTWLAKSGVPWLSMSFGLTA